MTPPELVVIAAVVPAVLTSPVTFCSAIELVADAVTVLTVLTVLLTELVELSVHVVCGPGGRRRGAPGAAVGHAAAGACGRVASARGGDHRHRGAGRRKAGKGTGRRRGRNGLRGSLGYMHTRIHSFLHLYIIVYTHVYIYIYIILY